MKPNRNYDAVARVMSLNEHAGETYFYKNGFAQRPVLTPRHQLLEPYQMCGSSLETPRT